MKTKLYNLKSRESNRKLLRQRMTKAEKILWARIRNRQIGFKFRRQYGIGKYIVDYCCPELELIIEIDGNVHFYKENESADRERQRFLEKLGFKIIRYTNINAIYNIESVLNDLSQKINLISPHPNPLLRKERERRVYY